MRALVIFFALALASSLAARGGEAKKKWRWTPPYKNDPAVLAKLKALGEGESAWLGPVKVVGLPEAHKKNSWLNKGPFTRGYCTKMPYAADRKTAFYCGQDHNLPHYNDAWEYHLGSNTWHCLTPPDGGDTANAWRRWPGQLKREKDPAKRKAIEEKITNWMKANVKFENGYLQTKVNDGPVMAWHTWDGLSYDPRVGKMFWVVLDDQKTNQHYLKTWCKYVGKDYETEKKKLKHGTGMWAFDPGTRKWSRWLGEKPHARMRGMGGSLHYLQDIQKMIWYCSATNVVPHEYGMWSYDAVNNKWAEIKPNGGKGIGGLVHKEKAAPPCEAQMAYSPRHRKMVSVVGKDTFVYDVAANVWSKAGTEKTQYASDCRTVFDYDSAADLFLLHNAPGGQWDKKRDLRAFDLKTGKWQTLTPKGAAVPKNIRKGFYDPEHNVFVLTDRGPVWVYRHKKAGVKRSAAKPKAAAPKKSAAAAVSAPKAAPRSPKQVCTGWFSSAKNYKKVGMLADARRCLKNIINTYPKSQWARQARSELGKL